jgi:hypothetical protein
MIVQCCSSVDLRMTRFISSCLWGGSLTVSLTLTLALAVEQFNPSPNPSPSPRVTLSCASPLWKKTICILKIIFVPEASEWMNYLKFTF